jgi:hypothetical protein
MRTKQDEYCNILSSFNLDTTAHSLRFLSPCIRFSCVVVTDKCGISFTCRFWDRQTLRIHKPGRLGSPLWNIYAWHERASGRFSQFGIIFTKTRYSPLESPHRHAVRTGGRWVVCCLVDASGKPGQVMLACSFQGFNQFSAAFGWLAFELCLPSSPRSFTVCADFPLQNISMVLMEDIRLARGSGATNWQNKGCGTVRTVANKMRWVASLVLQAVLGSYSCRLLEVLREVKAKVFTFRHSEDAQEAATPKTRENNSAAFLCYCSYSLWI